MGGSSGGRDAPKAPLPAPPPVKMEGEEAQNAAANWRKLWRKRSGRSDTMLTDPIESGQGESLLSSITGA